MNDCGCNDYPPVWDDMSHDHLLNHPLVHRYLHHHEDRGCDCNDDQLPVISRVGRGLQGDGYRVQIIQPDDCTQTYLEGLRYDANSGEYVSEWISDNINGGELSYQYNLRPFTIPQTFTITFIYRRPSGKGAMTGYNQDGVLVDMSNGKQVTKPRCCCIGSSPEWGKELGLPDNCSWSWTTPAIPYIWDADEDGEPDADHIVGSGVADLYIRTANKDYPDTVNGKTPKDDEWIEKLVYPPGTTGQDYNAPDPLNPWTVNLTFGLIGGDVLVPNLYDLAQLLGFSADQLLRAADGQKGQFGKSPWGRDWDNLKQYIDEGDEYLLDHFHDDLGFGDDFFNGGDDVHHDGGDLTVKDLLGWDPDFFKKGGTVKKYVDGLLDDLLKKIYFGGEHSSDPKYNVGDNKPAGVVVIDENNNPHILWTTPANVRIALGNMNLYGGFDQENYIITDDPGDNDVSAM